MPTFPIRLPRPLAAPRLAASTALAALLLISVDGGMTPASAGPLADGARVAEEKALAGDPVAAFEAARDALATFTAGLPFTIAKAVFVSEKPAAYGAYVPRANAVFKPGEVLITYVELIGLHWKPGDGGLLTSNFTVDLELKDAKGATLAAEKGFGNFSFTGHVQNQEVYTHLTLDVSGAKPGDYVAQYRVNDVLGQRSAVFEQPFTVAAP